MPKLCLNMIVKNESHIISETLKNIHRHVPIDYWVISDTGSTDNTIELILNTMSELGIPGEIFEDKWVNFSHNRNLALEHAKDKADYVFFFDADDYIKGNIDWPEKLTADSYYMAIGSSGGGTSYQRILIVKNGISKWRGVLHEFIDLPAGQQSSVITGNYHVVSQRIGSRNLNPDKYYHDALLLKQAIESGEDADLLPRYMFYCAQSYMDADRIDEAIYWYKQRVQCDGGWSEEAYMSCARLGALLETKGNEAEAIYYFTLGTNINPKRAECWYQLARINSWNSRAEISYLFAKKAASLTKPDGILFANMDIYQYWCHYQLFISAYNTGRKQVAYDALKNLINAPAPTSLYLDQLHIIKLLQECAMQDSHANILNLKKILTNKNAAAVIDALAV